MDKETEIWQPINGFESVYAVSNLGRIKSIGRYIPSKNGSRRFAKEKVLKPYVNKLGYLKVGLHNNWENKVFSVHRLIAIAFIPNPENKPQINHKNGNTSDNSIQNLEWATSKENIMHAFNVLKRKPSISSGEKCWLFGKRGKDHPAYGNKHMVGRKGNLSVRSKKVKCDTLDITFESACLASEALGIDQPYISGVCNGKYKFAHGLSFRYI